MLFGETDIHIFPGEAAALNVTGALGLDSSSVLVHDDDLSCGPLSPLDTPQQWQAMRQEFWHRAGSPETASTAGLFQWLVDNVARLRAAGAIRLWIGAHLAEQLLAAWLIEVFHSIGVDYTRLWIVELDTASYPSRPLASVALLNHKAVRRIADRWSALQDGRRRAYEAMWHAVSDESPELLSAFCGFDSPCPAHLKKILANYMLHYPDADSGLSHWDRELLEACRRNAPQTINVMGDVLGGGIERPYYSVPGPGYLFHRLKRMGDPDLPFPLIKLSGDRTDMRSMETWLTDAGLAVLNGEENAVALNGIDETIGGVTLSLSRGSLWLFDGETLVPMELP